jgi:hypothetical protein
MTGNGSPIRGNHHGSSASVFTSIARCRVDESARLPFRYRRPCFGELIATAKRITERPLPVDHPTPITSAHPDSLTCAFWFLQCSLRLRHHHVRCRIGEAVRAARWCLATIRRHLPYMTERDVRENPDADHSSPIGGRVLTRPLAFQGRRSRADGGRGRTELILHPRPSRTAKRPFFVDLPRNNLCEVSLHSSRGIGERFLYAHTDAGPELGRHCDPGHERQAGAPANPACYLPTSLGREDECRRLEAGQAVAREQRPKRRRLGVDSATGDVKASFDGSVPRELHEDRALAVHVASRRSDVSVRPESDPQLAVPVPELAESGRIPTTMVAIGKSHRADRSGLRCFCVAGDGDLLSGIFRCRAGYEDQNQGH